MHTFGKQFLDPDAKIWQWECHQNCMLFIIIYLLKVAGIDANWSLFISQCTGPWDEIIDKALWRISRLLLWLRTWNVHKHLKVDHFVNPAQCTRYLITLFCGDSFIFVAGAWTLLWLLLWPHNCYLNSLRAFYGQLLPHKVDCEASRVTRVTCGRVSVLARVCQENWFVTRFCFLAQTCLLISTLSPLGPGRGGVALAWPPRRHLPGKYSFLNDARIFNMNLECDFHLILKLLNVSPISKVKTQGNLCISIQERAKQ